MFCSEEALVDSFSSNLDKEGSCFRDLNMVREFQYPEGRADMIGSSSTSEVTAFEAKLDKWRVALYQAYRNSFYAHYSYVVLPVNKRRIALQYRHEFERRGVGLCTVNEEGIHIEIEACRKEPLRLWLTRNAVKATQAGGCHARAKIAGHC